MSQPSAHAGMGAVVVDDGVAFRVWAPFAGAVWVTGTFDDWAKDRHPLAAEGNGYWSVDVGDAGPGDLYLFVLEGADGALRQRIDPYARDVTHSDGAAIVVDPSYDWPDLDYRTPPWNEAVIYEMHIGTFNAHPDGPPGDFTAAIERLPYLAELGVNAIQVMPPQEFPTDRSWGYNPSNLFAIESAYGGPKELKRFVAEAHRLGMAVIFDVVYNHWGPGDLDLWQFDGWSENGKGGIYFYNDWRSTTPWGDTRPDYGRPEVRQYIRDNALFWLEEYHGDGLRWDATAWIRSVYGRDHDAANDLPDGWSLMQWVHDEIASRQPWKLSIAEDLQSNPWLTAGTGAGGAGFGSQWDPRFVHPVRDALIAGSDGERSMAAVAAAVAHRDHGDPVRRVIYTESHDEVANGKARVPEEIWPGNADSWASKKRSTLGAALVMTAPGIPMLFQGQEFLEDQWFHDADPIDWSKRGRFAGIVSLYRDLIALRRNFADRTRGLRGHNVSVHHVNDWDKVLAYHRWEQGGPGDDVVVVANFAARSYDGYTVGLPRGGTWHVRFNSDWSGYDPEFGDHPSFEVEATQGHQDGMEFSGQVGLGPYSAVILSQEP